MYVCVCFFGKFNHCDSAAKPAKLYPGFQLRCPHIPCSIRPFVFVDPPPPICSNETHSRLSPTRKKSVVMANTQG